MTVRLLQRESMTAVARSLLSCFYGISRASNNPMHATFFQKVIICAVAGLAAAGLIEWGKVFVEGADKALNGGYEHRTVMGTEKK
jgi:hypothetical protein